VVLAPRAQRPHPRPSPALPRSAGQALVASRSAHPNTPVPEPLTSASRVPSAENPSALASPPDSGAAPQKQQRGATPHYWQSWASPQEGLGRVVSNRLGALSKTVPVPQHTTQTREQIAVCPALALILRKIPYWRTNSARPKFTPRGRPPIIAFPCCSPLPSGLVIHFASSRRRVPLIARCSSAPSAGLAAAIA